MNLQEYCEYNGRCKKTLVFHFGTWAGFFSEYNNMVKMMAYCAIHKIQFKLYSSDCSFRREKGWNDFFEPFIEEVFDDFHHTKNKRFDKYVTTSFSRFLMSILRSLYHFDKARFCKYYKFAESREVKTLKQKHHFHYLTQDLWYDMRRLKENHIVKVDGLYEGNFKELCKALSDMIMVYNNEAKEMVRHIQSSFYAFAKKDNYIGMHIRGGDKYIETELLSYRLYFDKLREFDVFRGGVICLLTDDYRIYEMCRDDYPEYKIFTYCTKSEHGYFNEEFMERSAEEKYQKTLSLLAQVDLLTNASFFIGTSNSGPGEYLKMMMDTAQVYFLNE